MKRHWLIAYCPICSKPFEYLDDYKPKTCGKFDCLHAMSMRHDKALLAENTGKIPDDCDVLPMDAD